MYLVRSALVLCVAVAACSSFSLSGTDVVFHLFTRTNPQQSEPLLPNLGSIMASSFSISKRTIITIHSHGEAVNGNFNAFVINGILQGEDVNVVGVDWSPGSQLYTVGLSNAPQVGQITADFINILIDNFGYDPSLVSIVGVGLGGHIAGIAARNANGNISRITALDPSLFGWTHHPDILNADDADLVEVLHTTAGITGYDHPLGDLDFYPNGGSFQNGCGTDASCSHIYSYAFFAESVTSASMGNAQFVGTACESYEEAIVLQCSGSRDVVFGGIDAKSGVSGIYTFTTNASPPFARG